MPQQHPLFSLLISSAGGGIGLERLVMLYLGIGNIR
jgi:aspartyl/asparaginyl-tRNA synthetase